VPNAHIVAWIEEYLSNVGARVTRVPGPEGDRTNLFATIGAAEGPGLVLSGHMDVVLADEAD
jgi:acetylornithine deacetylase